MGRVGSGYFHPGWKQKAKKIWEAHFKNRPAIIPKNLNGSCSWIPMCPFPPLCLCTCSPCQHVQFHLFPIHENLTTSEHFEASPSPTISGQKDLFHHHFVYTTYTDCMDSCLKTRRFWKAGLKSYICYQQWPLTRAGTKNVFKWGPQMFWPQCFKTS